jgi:hypothetical protein
MRRGPEMPKPATFTPRGSGYGLQRSDSLTAIEPLSRRRHPGCLHASDDSVLDPASLPGRFPPLPSDLGR